MIMISMKAKGINALCLAAALLSAVVIAAPTPEIGERLGGDPNPNSHIVSDRSHTGRKLHGRFLQITDFHPDQFYKAHTSTAENYACHRQKGPAGVYGAETSDCDSPLALVNATMEWIGAHLKDSIDFVIWTGDSARHDSDDTIGREDQQILDTNIIVANHFSSTLSDSAGLLIPVVPTFGNNDILPHNVMLPGPNKWLKEYSRIWRDFIPDEQHHSFQYGGWFYTEVIPNHLAVFSLNTMYFFDRNAGIDDCAHPSQPGYKQLDWLRIQLQSLRDRGMKAILMGHVPPARTPAKQLWEETCWQKYTLWLHQYRDVVTASLFGHMNIDHFMLQDSQDVDLDLLNGGQEFHPTSETTQEAGMFEESDDLSLQSSADYLKDLRDGWASLPKPVEKPTAIDDIVDIGKGKKHRKGKKSKNGAMGGKFAERYTLSLVSPSIVPNYFPTLRVFEYNIAGLENSLTWADKMRGAKQPVEPTQTNPVSETDTEGPESSTEEARDSLDISGEKKKGGKNKGTKPSFIMPNPPPKTAPPGPAYSAQPLTLMGYTQYFANLTYLNNDMARDNEDVGMGEDDLSADRWNGGEHMGRKPEHPPHPRDFEFEVEYSTFEDKMYKLEDLTVRSLVDLAYRIGQGSTTTKMEGETVEIDDDEDEDEEEKPQLELRDVQEKMHEDDEDMDDDLQAERGGKHRGDKKKKRKHQGGKSRRQAQKLWFHFLKHAFVSTKTVGELRNMTRLNS